MSSFNGILQKLGRRENLTRDETREAFLHIMSGNAQAEEIRGLLLGLATKGASVEELVGAATVMREKAVVVPCEDAGDVLDTCGTGGDVRHTFNVSTAAAIIAAACGVKVVKHGNRSASGRAGSADVLEKLGMKLDVSPATLGHCLDKANICFAYARAHHPAMKHVAETRKALGIPTIFNLLGPLTNPGRARHQLIGVFAPELTDRLAAVLRELGSRRAWVVHAEDGLDEISTLGPTRISELRQGQIHTFTLDPAEVDLPRAELSDLQVNSVDEAAMVLQDVLSGRPSPKRDISVLNAAAALVVAEGAENLAEGLQLARNAIDNSTARRTLDLLVRCSNESV
ncbi:MAG: anthranilate phosphoribosyltransferase [Tepidisphaeraceae bacterium]|jgi:anthranilate phosphoribosyltransferase